MPGIIDQQLKATGLAQVLVILKDPAPSAAGAASKRSLRGGLSLDTTEKTHPHLSGLEKYFTESAESQHSALANAGIMNVAALGKRDGSATGRARRGKPPAPVLHFPNLGVVLGTVTRKGLAGLKSDPRVKRLVGTQQPSLIRPVHVAAATPTQKATWGIEFLQVPLLWNQGLTGKGVRVGHLDTGVDGKHPALKTAVTAFAEFDSFGREVTPQPDSHDTDEHGTHTAGTIAARAVSGKRVGVAPGAELASAIVIEGGDVVARILGGVDWSIDQGIRVLSMSLGLRGFFEDFLSVTQIIRDQNILPVFASGNEGPGKSRSPGNYSEALSIGAHDINGNVAGFSSSQRFLRTKDPLVPDLVAPGVDVISAKPGGKFQTMSGTSMATPHIAGLAALLFEAKPGASVADVETAIFSSCQVIPAQQARSNRGIPNAVRALSALTGIQLARTAGRSARSTVRKVRGRKRKQ